MLSKNKIKYITSLHKKKQRDFSSEFIVEGTKLVHELLKSNFTTVTLIATNQWLFNNKNILPTDCEIIECTADEMKKISCLKSPQNVLAIAKQRNIKKLKDLSTGLHIALDTIQDPGNMGTIIRIADWFGIDSIICSEDSADIYNPKVVQATMGAIFRVPVFYTDLKKELEELDGTEIMGTFLNGNNIYKEILPNKGIIVMGNEGNGISTEIEKIVTKRLYIPSFSNNSQQSESLNVAIATSITCSECRRNMLE